MIDDNDSPKKKYENKLREAKAFHRFPPSRTYQKSQEQTVELNLNE